MYDSDQPTDLGVHEGTAQVAWYDRPGRESVITFIGRWTDHDGVNHGTQVPLDFEVNVIDFGPFRAVVTVD
jgi:hypothetical protein